MDPLNRMSAGRPGLNTQRLDGRPNLQVNPNCPRFQDVLERASVQSVGEGVRAPEPPPKSNPVVEFLNACARTLSRWKHKIFG